MNSKGMVTYVLLYMISEKIYEIKRQNQKLLERLMDISKGKHVITVMTLNLL
jgi:hypothetical protein